MDNQVIETTESQTQLKPCEKAESSYQGSPIEPDEPLDYEAEDGENDSSDTELEEGEVTGDEDTEELPKETEVQQPTNVPHTRPISNSPICRYFQRGLCARGLTCRYLHTPQNWNIIQVPPYPAQFMRPQLFNIGPMMYVEPQYPAQEDKGESSWEKGLQAAKDILEKSKKLKEQNSNFRERKRRGFSPEDDKEDYEKRSSPRVKEQRASEHANHKRRRETNREPSRRREYSRFDRNTNTKRFDKRRQSPHRRSIRADEWSDPWMRSRSSNRKTDRTPSPYSSSSSYYTVSSGSGSLTRSPNGEENKSTPSNRKEEKLPRRRKTSESPNKDSPIQTENSSSPAKDSIFKLAAVLLKKSETGTSSSESSSDSSESTDSSSSESSTENESDKESPKPKIKLNLLKKSTSHSKSRPRRMSPDERKKKREELMKQLKAVEEAIARKHCRMSN